MSDIHGDLKAFKRLLDKINMDLDNDVLYLAGDVIDRGKEGLKVLKYLEPWLKKQTVKIIKGNHETFCQYYLEKKLSAERWSLFGGEYTLREVNQLTQEEKNRLLEFLRNLPYYIEEYSSHLNRCIITHSGVSCDWLVYNNKDKIDVVESIKLGIEMVGEYSFLIQDDIHDLSKGQMERFDSFIICGHKPTFRLQNERTVLHTPYYMDIDCGAGYRNQGGMLACYCIDTDKIFYT